jgi:hypothetical protein
MLLLGATWGGSIRSCRLGDTRVSWRSDVDQFDTADALCRCGSPALHLRAAVVTPSNRQSPGDDGHPDHQYGIGIEYAASVQKAYDLGSNGFLLLSVDAQVL